MSIQNYTYGVGSKGSKQLIDDLDLFWDQCRKGHRYYNNLISIERERRNKIAEAVLNIDPSIKKIFDEIQSIEQEYKNKKNNLCKVSRKERDENPLTLELKALKSKKKSLYDEYKKIRDKIWENNYKPFVEQTKQHKHEVLWAALSKEKQDQFKNSVQGLNRDEIEKEREKFLKKNPGPNSKIRHDILKQLATEWDDDPNISAFFKDVQKIEQEFDNACKKARHESGCFAGVYNHIHDAFKAAKKSSTPPNFRKWDGNGGIAIQLAPVLNLQDVFKENPRFYIKVTDDNIHGQKVKIAKGQYPRKSAQAVITLARNKVIKLNFVMHRPLPSNGVIKWVKVFAKRTGLHTKYELLLNISSSEFEKEPLKYNANLAVNFGWRVMEDGNIRVATIWDGANSETIELPAKLREQYKKYTYILGVADDHFNTVLKQLNLWKKNKQKLPENILDALENSHAWKSHGKLAVATKVLISAYASKYDKKLLWDAWIQDRLGKKPSNVSWNKWISRKGGDTFDTFDVISKWLLHHGVKEKDAQLAIYLDWWREKDAHLINYARNIEKKLKLHRREIFRRKAFEWSNKYQKVAFKKWNKSITAKKPAAEKDSRSEQEIKSNAIRQFCGISIFTNAIELVFSKKYVIKHDGDISTHYGCGGDGDNVVSNVMVQCLKCRKLYDQDLNAAMHIYDAQFERSGGKKNSGTARSAVKTSKKRTTKAKTIH